MTSDMRAPEFSRPLAVVDVASAGRTLELEASAAERAALAQRLDLLGLDRLWAQLVVKPIAGGPMLRVTGRFGAALTPACVVTLEPVPETIEETVDLRFGPPGEAAREVSFALDEDEPPEPIEEGRIDLGELVTQLLSLALDPYPRAPGAAVPAEYAPQDDTAPRNPFTVLAQRPKRDR